MNLAFKKATKTQARLRLALIGVSGGGKTYSALAIASALELPVAVIDTERGSAAKYADLFAFDVLELESFAPATYVAAIQAAAKAGYKTLVIDSLSHAWSGKEGALEQVDRAAKRSQSANTFAAWRDVTPMHNALVDAILGYPGHVIATMRAKTEYVLEEDSRGKKVPTKKGMAPIQRDGLEYEFDVVADMTMTNDMIVSKSRCPAMSGQVYTRPGADVAGILRTWLTDGAPAPPPPLAAVPPPRVDVEKIGREYDAEIDAVSTRLEAVALYRRINADATIPRELKALLLTQCKARGEVLGEQERGRAAEPPPSSDDMAKSDNPDEGP